MKRFLILMFLTLTLSLLNAQPRISISGGVKLIGAESKTITLGYVDESPSRDNIYKDIDPIKNFAVNLNVRWNDISSEKALKPYFELQGYVGGIWGLALGGGYTYTGKSESNVRIQPELSAILGYCTKGIGEIQNNSIYIQVNNTKFQDYTNVNAALQNAYIGLKPGISFVFKAGVEREFGIGVNYQISYKAGFISFSGSDQNGASASEIEYLSANNVGFYVDGNRTDNNPYNPDGLEFKIFYSF